MQTQTDRETDRHTHRQTDRQRDIPAMFKEGVYTVLAVSIPDLHRLVITARHYQTTVRRKPTSIQTHTESDRQCHMYIHRHTSLPDTIR